MRASISPNGRYWRPISRASATGPKCRKPSRQRGSSFTRPGSCAPHAPRSARGVEGGRGELQRRRGARTADTARSSSACVPTATLRPWSMTTMRSAFSTVARRCAMMMVVRPRMSCFERLLHQPLRLRRRASWWPRRAAESAGPSGWRARARCAGAGRPKASCRARPGRYRSPAAACAGTRPRLRPRPQPRFRLARLGAPVADVLAGARAEQHRLLRHQADLRAHVLRPQILERRRHRSVSCRNPDRRSAAAAGMSCSCRRPRDPTKAMVSPGATSRLKFVQRRRSAAATDNET